MVSNMAGIGRVAMHGFHTQPVRNQLGPIPCYQSTIPVSQPYVFISSQSSYCDRLDPVIHHLSAATRQLARKTQ